MADRKAMNVSAKIGNGGSAAFRKSNSIAVASPPQLNSNNNIQ